MVDKSLVTIAGQTKVDGRLWYRVQTGDAEGFLPASRVLLGLALTAYLLVSTLLALPGYSVATSLQIAITDLLVLALFAGSVRYASSRLDA